MDLSVHLCANMFAFVFIRYLVDKKLARCKMQPKTFVISILTLNARLQNAWNVCAVSGLKGHNAAVRKKPVASISDCVAFTAFTITEMNPAISNATHMAGVLTVLILMQVSGCVSGQVLSLH